MIPRPRNANGAFLPVHGKAHTRTFNIWRKMLQRCYDQKAHNWKWYGGKGIAVCDRWREVFANFLEDMGECPDGLSIDRIDGSGNYEPGNCRWATHLEQARNQSHNVNVEYGGRCLCLSQWAEETGVGIGTLWWRHRAGWSAARMIETPVKGRK